MTTVATSTRVDGSVTITGWEDQADNTAEAKRWRPRWQRDSDGLVRVSFPDLGDEEELFTALGENIFALFCQDTYWRDINEDFHRLSDMEYSYLRNLGRFLDRGERNWRRVCQRDLSLYLIEAEDLKDKAKNLLDDAMVALEKPGFLANTVLYRAIEAERQRRINAAEVMALLETDEERELYYRLMENWPEEPYSAAVVCRDDARDSLI